MSYADNVFKEMCRDILENGTSTEGEKVRPHWEDGTLAYTIKRFGIVNRYDLRKEFPALTLRRTALKSAFDEILWIWQKKSNNIHDLHSHIWDSWADEDGSIERHTDTSWASSTVIRGVDGSGRPGALRFEEQPLQQKDHDQHLCPSGSL